MTKTTSSLFLSICLLSLQAANAVQGRYLQEDGNGSADYNNNGNSGNNKSFADYKSDLSYKWSKTSSQVNQDLNGMWNTTPSEWGDEYWEVFVGLVGFAFLLTFCLMLICCTPCCCNYADDNVQYVATQEELDAKKRMKQPILNQDTLSQAESSVPTRTVVSSNSTVDTGTIMTDPPVSHAGNSTTADSSIPSKVPRRRRRTLWEETVIVWKDFLRNGMYVPEQDDMSYYKRYEREERQKRRSRSASNRRRRSSSRARRGEMV